MQPLRDGLVSPPRIAGRVLAGGVTDLGPVGAVDPAYRALASFVLVSLFGVVVLVRSREFVEGSVDTSMARPHVSGLYGLIGFVIIAFLGFIGLMQASYLGGFGSLFIGVIGGLVAIAALVLGGLGYTVVGTRLVEMSGGRRPWRGLLLGAALSAVGWLLFPPLVAALAWLLVPAVGIGGPVREWIHAERTVATESQS